MYNIYVVEDEDNIRDLVVYALNNSGFKAVGLLGYKELEKELLKKTPDLIILDIMLEEEDGYTILEKLKSSDKYCEIPVIMLTAKTDEMDKVRGLDMGADDYITKPFGVMELISRIKAVLRRAGVSKKIDENNIVEFKNIVIDLNKRIVTVNNEIIKLTYKEFELLLYLIENKNIVLTRQKLTEEIWGFDYEGETRTVDVHIRTLRQKLGELSSYIVTVRNVGYKIVD
ncbi:response regulator transcription factor [Miniphocaeibacter halophilus]|uniref:Response regulator transcription factor n=1 Tax=Miniphocaeibacter halophilus TaxID=2931922 RepID=A0AC61NB57_9FIRM|nr:response regulator transcription factor [Miniphocaeibacter halophilus]QQK08543.1 response regulator transcription factor [Miniphocaeibacter halophilus]